MQSQAGDAVAAKNNPRGNFWDPGYGMKIIRGYSGKTLTNDFESGKIKKMPEGRETFMNTLIRNALVFRGGSPAKEDLFLKDGVVSDFRPCIPPVPGETIYDFSGCVLFPGFSDVHVHLREPGFSYKETIRTGTAAAAHGGFTDVCAMPNLRPVPDCAANLEPELEAVRRDALVRVHPYGSVTVGEKQAALSAMEELAPRVVAFSDDGVGVQSAEMMESAMRKAKSLGKIVAAHCEVDSLVRGGVVHAGRYAREHGLPGISSESEWREVERDLDLVRKTGCDYHVCHVSTKESVALIRKAKAEGLPVTCETAPHYLLLCEDDLRDDGRFKMNPPLRGAEDRAALREGLLDGTIDMVATDHAPHAAEEKAGGLRKSKNGVVGLETAFPVLYTGLVKTGLIPLEKLLALMNGNPRRRFGVGGVLEIGKPADLAVWDLNAEYAVDPERFLSRGRATPFAGMRAFGKCLLTMAGGRTVWREGVRRA